MRSPQHYRGSVAGLDPRAGHIPGAVNVPTLAHIAPDGRFRSSADIAATLRAAGVSPTDPVVVYCGSGIASAHSVLAYSLVGVDAALYPGSWSQWSRERGRPVAVGAGAADTVLGS